MTEKVTKIIQFVTFVLTPSRYSFTNVLIKFRNITMQDLHTSCYVLYYHTQQTNSVST